MTIPDRIERYAQREEFAELFRRKIAEGIAASVQRRAARHARVSWNDNHARIVALGGGEYVPGMLGDLVLFNSPATGSTLALHEADLTPEAVRQHIAESNARFGVRS